MMVIKGNKKAFYRRLNIKICASLHIAMKIRNGPLSMHSVCHEKAHTFHNVYVRTIDEMCSCLGENNKLGHFYTVVWAI